LLILRVVDNEPSWKHRLVAEHRGNLVSDIRSQRIGKHRRNHGILAH
jgi:hypothetical protein